VADANYRPTSVSDGAEMVDPKQPLLACGRLGHIRFSRTNNLMSITKVRFTTALLLAYVLAETNATIASQVDSQGSNNSAAAGVRQIPPNREQLSSAIREAIFRNRQQLLAYLEDSAERSVICTPAANDSYEFFQASLREELDVLWDLDIYAVKYGLNEKQHNAVRACSGAMEKYLDNFKLWQHLNRH
jgi:hypothetical protein